MASPVFAAAEHLSQKTEGPSRRASTESGSTRSRASGLRFKEPVKTLTEVEPASSETLELASAVSARPQVSSRLHPTRAPPWKPKELVPSMKPPANALNTTWFTGASGGWGTSSGAAATSVACGLRG